MFWTAAWIMVGAAALAAGLALRVRRRRLGAAEAELEVLRDALWEAREREERAHAEGARALAEAREKSEAAARVKSRFLATVTHEMRTPLSGVIGTAELLLDTALAPDQRTYAHAVKTSADAMLSLVDEMLDLSRIEADRITLQSAPFDLAELVEGVAELLAPRAQAKGLDLAVRIAAGAPAQLMGDAARLRQILLNLAGNAIKFTTAGGVGLRVERDGAAVRFAVMDTGPGFDPADRDRIFGEFERAGADPAAPGVGLGLAISARLAHAMNGALAAETRPGEGATFTLTLPAEGAVEAAAEGPLLEGRRVLVVSRTPFGGPWLAERLGECGAAARLTEPKPADAVAADVRAFGADTVLIDLDPTYHASDLALAARRGGARTTLALLAPSDRREAPALAADGFDGFLIKPVRAGSLISRLNDPRPIGAPAPAAPTTMSFPRAHGLRVLLAEDDAVSALIAVAHLARLGHSATQTGDGREACAAFEAGGYDAVLMDVRMPGLDGLEAARRMRRFERDSGRAPALIVAISANVSPDDLASARAAGMDELMAKPLDPRRLAALLDARRPAAPRLAPQSGNAG